jgi:hypothetical protein
MPDIFLDIIEIYKVGIMRSEEVSVIQQILKLLEIFETRILRLPVMKNQE